MIAHRRRHVIRCEGCRAKFVPVRASHRFCSPACRQRAYTARQKAAAATAATVEPIHALPRRQKAACAFCGDPFRRSNARQLYCRPRCRTLMSEARRAGALDVLITAYALPPGKAADLLDVQGLIVVRAALERAGWSWDAPARRWALASDLNEWKAV